MGSDCHSPSDCHSLIISGQRGWKYSLSLSNFAAAVVAMVAKDWNGAKALRVAWGMRRDADPAGPEGQRMLCRSVPSTWPSAPIPQGTGRGRALDGGAQRGHGLLGCSRLPLPLERLSGAAGSGTGANRTSASSKGFLGAADPLPCAAGKGPRGGCEARPCAKLVHLCPRAQGASPCRPGDLQHIFLPVPGLPWGDGRAVPGCWQQGGTGFSTGQMETRLGHGAGVNTWMLPGHLGLGLQGPRWLGHS